MIFVTGGTGLLGSHLLVELCKRNLSIRALKRESSSLDMVRSVFEFYLGANATAAFNKIEWVNGDILDITSLGENMEGCDSIYHCAGFVSFHKKDFIQLLKINKEGTANMVNVALHKSIKKFCHVSSTAAIGRDKKNEYYTEESKWIITNENSNYAVSKYSGEMEVWRGIMEGLNATIVNPSVIIGAGSWQESSMTIFNKVKQGLNLYTTGMNAFVDARDVAYCMVALMEGNKMNNRFLTIGENVFFKDLFFMVADHIGVKRPSVEVKPWMAGLAWRFEKLRCFLTRKKPSITKETAKSAMSISKYDNKKVKEALNFEFTSIDKAVENAVKFNKFKESKKS